MSTLTHVEYLFSIGEIGVAYAGFAGLITVVANSFRRSSKVAAEKIRLRNVVVASILLVLGSLLPYVSVQFFTSNTAWRVSSQVFSFSIGLFLYFEVFLPTLRVYKQNLTADMSWLLFFPKQGFLALSAVILLFVSFTYDVHVQKVYILSIYVLLVHASTSLIRLLLSLANEGDA